MEETKRSPLVEFWDSPWFGIGFGVVIGAFGSLLSVKWLIAFGWVVISIQIFRHDFVRKGTMIRLTTNLVASCVLGLIFFGVWHFLPKPPEPLTKSDIPKPLSKQETQEAVMQALPPGLRNFPTPAVQTNSGNPTKADLTQMVKAAIAAANPNGLSNLTVDRLNDEVKSTVKDANHSANIWGSKLNHIDEVTVDRIQFYKDNPSAPLGSDSMPPQLAAEERRKGEQRKEGVSNEEREKTRNTAVQLCDFRTEIMTRLDSSEVGDLGQDKQVKDLCSQIKTVKYQLQDMLHLVLNVSELQKKLAYRLTQ
jgi:hypothetical protein